MHVCLYICSKLLMFFCIDDYDNFKRDIHKLFPYIIDTKHIAFALNRHEVSDKDCIFQLDITEIFYTGIHNVRLVDNFSTKYTFFSSETARNGFV